MSVSLNDVQGTRVLEIDGGNQGLPDSVFFICQENSREFAIEIPKEALVRALAMELDLIARSVADQFVPLSAALQCDLEHVYDPLVPRI